MDPKKTYPNEGSPQQVGLENCMMKCTGFESLNKKSEFVNAARKQKRDFMRFLSLQIISQFQVVSLSIIFGASVGELVA